MRCKGYHVDASRANYETSQGGLRRAGLIFAEPGDPPPTFVWVDGILRKEDAIEHEPYQRFNKIPGMDFICYKSTLFKTLNEMQKLYPTLFDVYPRTFLLPKEFLDFQREHKAICGRSMQAPSWVVKPRNSCCGRGISIVQSVAEVQSIDYEAVIQQYITPFLIDGHKFDFRLYILIASLQPLAIFIYKEGIARFCTQIFEFPSKSNRNKKFMHLTNTAINIENSKESPLKFTKLASEVLDTISKRYHNGDQLWNRICEVCRAVIIGLYGAILNNLPKKCDEKSPAQKRYEMILKNRKTIVSKIATDMHSDRNDNQTQSTSDGSSLKTDNFSDSSNSVSQTQIQRQNQSHLIQNQNQMPFQNKQKIVTNNMIISAKKKPKITRPNITEGNSSSRLNITNKITIIPVINKTNHHRSMSLSPDHGKEIEKATNQILQSSGANASQDCISTENDIITENESEIEIEEEGNGNKEQITKESEDKEPNYTSTEALPLRKRFFHILGIDIMIDSEMNPKVLELNDRPSLGITVDFEKELKEKLISEAYEHVSPNGNWYGNNENSDWIQIYPLPFEEATKSQYPKIVNNFLNPPQIGSDIQKSIAPIQFPKRSVPDFLHYKEKPQKKKKKKKTRRESK